MAEQYHHLPDNLPRYGTDTFAQWAVTPGEKAIVFVHGFKGHAVDTWTDFPAMLTADSRLAGVDLYFFGYDGLTTQAGVSAAVFQQFIEDLGTDPTEIFGTNRGVRPGFVYTRILLVAHSLGAVVVRRALLDAATDDSTAAWLNRVKLILFAPAHRGAYAAVLASGFLSEQDWWLGRLAAKVVAYNVPLLEDLKPGSSVLQQLDSDTHNALATSPDAPHLVAAHVVWTQYDKVVLNLRFGADRPPELVATDHLRVCKPTNAYPGPLNTVVRAL
jgi:alpha-beta hydrolase superfamily lysophospholipase